MTVTYKLEPADCFALAEERRAQFNSESLSKIYYFGLVPILGVGLAIATQSIGLAVIFTSLYISTGWLVNLYSRRHLRQTGYSDDNLSFAARTWQATLTDQGVNLSSDAAEILYRWPFIQRVFRSSRYLCLEITPLYRVHIPTSAFADEEQIQSFTAAAKSHIENSLRRL